jgi:hypothetical protein
MNTGTGSPGQHRLKERAISSVYRSAMGTPTRLNIRTQSFTRYGLWDALLSTHHTKTPQSESSQAQNLVSAKDLVRQRVLSKRHNRNMSTSALNRLKLSQPYICWAYINYMRTASSVRQGSFRPAPLATRPFPRELPIHRIQRVVCVYFSHKL